MYHLKIPSRGYRHVKNNFFIDPAVDMSKMLKKRVLEAWFYVAQIQDETFSLDTPNEFQAKCF